MDRRDDRRSNLWLFIKVFAVLALVFGWVLAFNGALRLLSAESDAGVAFGALFAFALCGVAAVALRVAWRRARRIARARGLNLVALGALVSLTTTGCWTVVEPGHVGIRVNQSGSDRGVQDFPLQSGRVFYNPITETVFQYPTYVQRAIWTATKTEGSASNEEISYNSKDELVFTGDFAVSYQLVRDRVPQFYVKFRNADIEGFTHGFFRDQVRDGLNEVAVRYTADELYGEKKSEFLTVVKKMLEDRVKDYGVEVVALGYASPPRPPKQVADAINSKIAAIQLATQKVNELKQTEADAKKIEAKAVGEAKSKVALAEGEAKANEIVTKSITDTIIKWRQLDVQQEALRRWDGKLPQYSGGPLPFISVK